MFRDFGRRLQRDLKRTVDARLKLSEELSGGKLKVWKKILKLASSRCEDREWNSITVCVNVFLLQPKPIDVQVITHHMQRYAVWFGGSMLASTVSPAHSTTKQILTDVVFSSTMSPYLFNAVFLCVFVFSPQTNIAWVLPGVSHQEGLWGDWPQHLSPQPCVWCHVLRVHWPASIHIISHTHTHTR